MAHHPARVACLFVLGLPLSQSPSNWISLNLSVISLPALLDHARLGFVCYKFVHLSKQRESDALVMCHTNSVALRS